MHDQDLLETLWTGTNAQWNGSLFSIQGYRGYPLCDKVVVLFKNPWADVDKEVELLYIGTAPNMNLALELVLDAVIKISYALGFQAGRD